MMCSRFCHLLKGCYHRQKTVEGEKIKLFKLVRIIFLLLIVVPCVYLLAYELGVFGSEAEWSPIWSPDGNKIAFECAYPRPSDFSDAINNPTFFRDVREICVFDLTTGKYKRLTNNHRVSPPTWSPTGDKLAWISSHSIIIWDTQTSKQTEFKSYRNIGYRSFPAWSQLEDIIYIQGDGGKFNINTGEFSLFISSLNRKNACCFTWSPDGQYLAYKRVKLQDLNGRNHWRLIIEQGDNILYESEYDTDFSGDLFTNMQWSPDGNTLAWIEEENGYIVLTYLPTLQTTLIDDTGFYSTDVAWASNSKKIAVRSDQFLYILDLELSETQSKYTVVNQKKLIINARTFGDLSWSPDSKYLAYETSYDLDSVIWLVDLDTNKQHKLIKTRH